MEIRRSGSITPQNADTLIGRGMIRAALIDKAIRECGPRELAQVPGSYTVPWPDTMRELLVYCNATPIVVFDCQLAYQICGIAGHPLDDDSPLSAPIWRVIPYDSRRWLWAAWLKANDRYTLMESGA